MSTLEQRRAAFALEKVESVRDAGGQAQAKYKTQLVKLPARLHTSGLGQTVAFYLASGGGSPEGAICGWLEEWLQEAKIYGEGKLIHWITGSAGELAGDGLRAETLYRQASAEARALAVWLKRFAEAFLGEGETGGASGGGGGVAETEEVRTEAASQGAGGATETAGEAGVAGQEEGPR